MGKKKVIKSVLGFGAGLIILAGMIYYAGILLRPTDTDIAFSAMDAFHSMPEDSIEVMVYGSSHGWVGVDSMEMYKNYGVGAYNYACNWQHINTTSLFFHDSLRTQSPKVVLIETYRINALMMDTDINGEIYYTRGIPASSERERYLKQCFGDDFERYLSYYVPFVAFHRNWNNIQEKNFQETTSNREIFFQTMGFWPIERITPIDIGDYRKYQQAELCDDAIEVLDEIVKTCDQNNIQIVFFTTPYQANYPYFDAIREYAEENGCQYINFFEKMDEIGIDCETDFYDEDHFNTSGAKKVSDYLGQYLMENYDLTDMRKKPGNLWEINMIE